MYSSLEPILVWLLIIAVFAFAWAKGGAPERWGVGIVLAGGAFALLVHWGAPASLHALLLLGGEGAMGLAFLMLALRYASPWLGGAMLFQAIQFSLHAYYLVGELPRDFTYAVINNIDTLGVLACILLGALLAWRKRNRLAK
ncbi:hypothetical protein [Caulobacter sp. DWR1-3-2b1]|uniref:hypothetical protein n=1 Tax=Caulobacter sp. DWR1-3-2b1 TaxID=2804670 RepID=UPI003CEFD8BC